MTFENPYMQELIEKFSPRMNIYLAPHAHQVLAGRLLQILPDKARLREAGVGSVLTDPGIVILTPADLRGTHREALLSLTHLMRPARPVLYGGTSDRDALLDAINNWRVVQVLPESCPPSEIMEAARRSHETLTVDVILQNAANELAAETERLDTAIEELRAARERLLHTERLTTVGRIADGLIAAIRQHLRALEQFEQSMGAEYDDELRETLESAFEGMRSIGTLLDEIHAYADNRERQYELESEPLDDVIQRVVGFTRFDQLARDRNLVPDLQSRALVRMDRHRIYQVLINLIRNAFQATRSGDTIHIRSRVEGDRAIVEVADPGCGIPPEIRPHMFDPFFTTKGEQGMGLGLSVSRVAIERQHGTITCESRVGEGTTFRIALPLSGRRPE